MSDERKRQIGEGAEAAASCPSRATPRTTPGKRPWTPSRATRTCGSCWRTSARGVGLTLAAATNVALVKLGWTPAEHDHTKNRCHRIGREAGSVDARYLPAEGTIDQGSRDLVERKRREWTRPPRVTARKSTRRACPAT